MSTLVRSLKVSLPGTKWNYHVNVHWWWTDFRIGVSYISHESFYKALEINLLWLTIVIEQG